MAEISPAPLPTIHKRLFADPPVYLCLLCAAEGATAPQLEAVEAHVRQAHAVEPVLTMAAQGRLDPVPAAEVPPVPAPSAAPEKG